LRRGLRICSSHGQDIDDRTRCPIDLDFVFEARVDRQTDGSVGDLETYIASLEGIIARYHEHSALLGAVNHVAELDDSSRAGSM
jgi:hypothetical protein